MSLRRDAYWTALDTILTSGFAFLLRLFVAKMLAPTDFGVAMIAVTVVTLLQTINDFGLTATLIQRDKKDVTPDLIDTTFTASVIITTLIMAFTAFVVAPQAARAYAEPQLLPLILMLSITMLPSPFVTVAGALMYREGRFRSNAVIRVASNLLGMVAAIAMLFVNPSPWVIVLQMAVAMVSNAIMLLIAHPYRYKLRLVREHIGPIFGFSTYILLGGLFTNAQANAGVFVLGFVASAAAVGQFALATYFTDTVRKIVMQILNRVTFVHFSRAKHDQTYLCEKFVSTVKWNCRALFPMMTAMMLFGPTWAPQLMGPEWATLGPLIFWLSLTVIVGTAGGATSNLYKSMGRPGLDLMFQITTTGGLLLPGIYAAGYFYGLQGAAIATFAVKVIAVAIRMVALQRLLPGAPAGVLRVSVHQSLLQTPIVVGWLLARLLGLHAWYYQAPLLAIALAIYALIELPRAFPDVWQRVRQPFARRSSLGH